MEPRVLKPMFDLGQLGLMPYSARDDDSIRDSIKSSDIVINLVGKHYETKHIVPHRTINGKPSRVNWTFDEVHSEIPRKLARLSKEAGVSNFIHVSALAANNADSKSEWSISKAAGERAVKEEFPEATIVRPATVFGPEDRFLNWIADTTEKFGAFPLLNGGKQMLQPVYSKDVALALMAIVNNCHDLEGKTFELVGPNDYTMREVTEFVQDVTTLRKPLIDIPVPLASLAAKFLQNAMNPLLTEDGVSQMQDDVMPSNAPGILGFADLGIVPHSMDKVAFDYLHRFRPGGHFTMVEGYHKDLKI